MSSFASVEVVKNLGDGEYCTDNTIVEDTETLSSILVSAVTQSQQEGSGTSSAFQVLLDYLTHSSLQHTSMLAGDPQFQHYLHRLVRSEVKYAREDNIAKLAVHFPSAVAHFQEKQLAFSYSYSDIPSVCDDSIHKTSTVSGKAKARVHGRPATGGVDGLYGYHPALFPVTFRGPQVKVSDLTTAIVSVSNEMKEEQRTRDGYHAICSTKGAPVNTCLSRRVTRRKKNFTERAGLITRDIEETPNLCPLLMKDVDDSHFRISKSGHSLFPRNKTSKRPFQTTSPYLHGTLHTAQDAIEAFASGKFVSESEFVYLNYTNPDKSCPYDLTVVPKTKVHPEHFIMSKFGIILVTPDETSTFQMFSDWLREASLYTLIRQITFFREYKIRRALKQWVKVVRHLRFRRLCDRVNKMAIRFLPVFSDALLQLKILSDELLTVSFHNLKPLGGYTLHDLEDYLRTSQSKACHLLNKYFKYSKRLVCGVITTAQSQLLKFNVNDHYHSYTSDLSISIQQEKCRIWKRNLNKAVYYVNKLGCFIDLAERMVLSYLMQLAQHVVGTWKEVLLCQDSILHQASSGFHIPVRIPSTINLTSTNAPLTSAPLERADSTEPEYFLLSSLVFDESGKFWCSSSPPPSFLY